MILKPFQETATLKGLRTLLQRLDSNHPLYSNLSQELQQVEAGDIGEQYILKQLTKLAHTLDIAILHNITFSVPIPIQLDIVVITPYDVVIIESKNIRGSVELKRHPRQMIRTLENGDRRVFNHPEIQLEEYIFGLETFLKQHQFQIDVTGIVVFPFNNAEIHYDEKGLPVLTMRELSNFLRQHVISKQSQRKISTAKIANLLIEHHRMFPLPPLCSYYNIEPHFIKKGVICRNCIQSKLIRNKKSWFCPNCKMYDKTAHHQALEDYRLLINNQINTETARHYLEIPDRHVTKRLLQGYSSQTRGHNNQMLYQL